MDRGQIMLDERERDSRRSVRCGDGGTWSKFRAYRDGMEYTVHERIVSERDGSTWTDAPAWFWDALRHPLNGPWRAETLILP